MVWDVWVFIKGGRTTAHHFKPSSWAVSMLVTRMLGIPWNSWKSVQSHDWWFKDVIVLMDYIYIYQMEHVGYPWGSTLNPNHQLMTRIYQSEVDEHPNLPHWYPSILDLDRSWFITFSIAKQVWSLIEHLWFWGAPEKLMGRGVTQWWDAEVCWLKDDEFATTYLPGN